MIMQVNEKEMYHFHNNIVYNDLWIPGNEIIVDDNFESAFLKILNYYSTAVNTKQGIDKEFNIIIDRYIEKKQKKDTLIDLLKEASGIIRETNIFKRELALEQIRKEKFPDLPSRKHSIWLCDELGLSFWQDQISHNNEIKIDLFKVLVTGNLFKSSDIFLPNDNTNYETNLKEALNYWNPKFINKEQEKKAEYLFQGKVKILEKIK